MTLNVIVAACAIANAAGFLACCAERDTFGACLTGLGGLTCAAMLVL